MSLLRHHQLLMSAQPPGSDPGPTIIPLPAAEFVIVTQQNVTVPDGIRNLADGGTVAYPTTTTAQTSLVIRSVNTLEVMFPSKPSGIVFWASYEWEVADGMANYSSISTAPQVVSSHLSELYREQQLTWVSPDWRHRIAFNITQTRKTGESPAMGIIKILSFGYTI